MIGRLAERESLVGLGLSGGTSADGLDAALVRFAGGRDRVVAPELLAWRTAPLSGADRARLAVLAQGADAREMARAHVWLGQLFGRAARRLALDHPEIRADFAACGGQTVAHLGLLGTLQLGLPAAIAEIAGLPVVADFRSSDVAAWGEGAPLAPFLDWVLFRDRPGTAALNIGGMANLTWVEADPERVLAFDTGPGNSLADRCARWASGGRLACDEGGELAAAGTLHGPLLEDLLAHPFLEQRPPRSTGLETWGDECFADLRRRYPDLAAGDLAATLALFTARSIALALRFLPRRPERIVVTGGGAHNPVLVARLAEEVAPVPLLPYPAPGWTDAKEAVLWALLGHETLRSRPSNLPGATGARGRRILGSITLPPPPS